jgi:hypothetical protein
MRFSIFISRFFCEHLLFSSVRFERKTRCGLP